MVKGRELILGDVADFVNGDRSSNYPSGSDFAPSGIPFINAGDLDGGKVDVRSAKTITAEAYDRLRSGKVLPGDILFCLRGSLGKVGRFNADLNAAIASSLVIIRARETADQQFLYYFLQGPSVQRLMAALDNGSAQPNLSVRELSRIIVPDFTVSEQRAIGRTLGVLDDKIELNRKMSATLEAMVQALFKSWFIDFDPVRAKAENRDARLPTHISMYFPSDYMDSDIGKIPKGWTCIPIRDSTTNIQYGLTASATNIPDGPKFLRITDIQGGRVNWENVPYCAASNSDFHKYRLIPGDVVVARTGASTGENLYISHCPEAVFASYLVRFQCADRATSRFIGAFLRTPAYFDYISNSIGGSAQPNASAQVLAGAMIALPPLRVREEFMRFVSPLDDAIHAKSKESQTLASLRDALLPKLMSGEIRLDDAERIVEMSA